MMHTSEPTEIMHQSMDGHATSSEKMNYNVDLQSFYHQLSQDDFFNILPVVPSSETHPRHEMRRNSAPPIIEGATPRKTLSNNNAVNATASQSGSKCERRHSADDSTLLQDTIFDDALESVIDEVDSILYGEDNEI